MYSKLSSHPSVQQKRHVLHVRIWYLRLVCQPLHTNRTLAICTRDEPLFANQRKFLHVREVVFGLSYKLKRDRLRQQFRKHMSILSWAATVELGTHICKHAHMLTSAPFVSDATLCLIASGLSFLQLCKMFCRSTKASS